MTKMKFFVGVAVFALAFFAGTEANAAYMHSMTLKMGMTNVQVKALQQQLNMTSCKVSVIGVGSAGYETMYFGAKTKAAVQCFQMANGLVADGIVGPMTGSKLAGASGNVVVVPVCPPGFTCTPAGGSTGGSTGGTTTGGLSGTVGSLDYTLVSSLSNEDVGEGDNNVKVAGLELDADDSDSDVRITAVKLNFDVGTAGSDFEDYAEEVSVWFGSTKVATVDADEFNDDNDFEKTVSLSGDTIVRKGDSENLYVAISAVSNLDTNDINDTWTVDFTQIRFVDAQGAVTTEADAAIGTAARTFTFKSFASANDVDLVVDLNDDEEDINLAHVVNVESGATDTEDVEVLAFTLEAEGDSDIDVTEIPATLTTTGETDESLILIQAKLWHDGEVIATDSSIAAGGAVLFDELDLTIEAGDTEEFIISVDLQDLTGALDEGDTVQASITTTNAEAIEAEDESGEDLTATEISGSAVGEASAVYDIGFNLQFVSASATKTFSSETSTVGDQGQFVIKYKVTALDGDIYIDNTCVEDNDGSEVATATSYSITNDGSNSTSCVMTATGSTTHADVANTFLVEEGDTETFTLTVNATATADAFAQVKLEAIGWDDAAGGDDNVFTFGLPGIFKTDPLFLNLY